MKKSLALMVVSVGSLAMVAQAQNCASQNADLQKQVIELQKELSAARTRIAAQDAKLQRIRFLANDVGVIEKIADTKDAERMADKATAMAALQAELEAAAKNKENPEAVAALKDFGVNTLGARMKQYWRLPPNIPENLSVKIFVKLDRNGNIVKANIKHSSGYKKFDDAALKAVHDASPLPMPKHPGAVDALVSDGIITKFDP
ncbi:energy transducer TonB [Cardiobacterium hominis]|jgi:tonB family C-terminal domain